MNTFTDEVLIITSIVLLALYFLPTIIAWRRGKSNIISIFLLNFFLGWSFIGWMISLFWACSSEQPQTVIVNNTYSNHEPKMKVRTSYDSKLDNLQRLKTLLDTGVLSQAEFDEQKAKILAD